MTQIELLNTLIGMNEEIRNDFYKQLAPGDAKTIKEMVFFYKLYNDKTFYNAEQHS